MYIMPEMIHLGLNKNQNFPTVFHEEVAKTIALCNPNVKEIDILTNIVQSILKVPNDRITQITYKELVNDYHMSDVGMYE